MKMNLMKMDIYKFAIIVLFVFFGLVISNESKADAYTEVFYKNLNYTGEIEESVINNIENGFNIVLNTEGYEKGYYTEFFSPGKDLNLEGVNAIAFNIKNNCSNELRMNFVCSTEKEEFKIQDENKIFVEEESSGILEELKMQYGTFNIEKEKNITIYIPLRSLNMEEIKYVNNFGFSITCEEDKNINFDIINFTLLRKDETNLINNMLSKNIIGDDEVVIPTAGESIASYRVEGLDSKVYFSTLENYIGVDIDGDGVLHVKDTAEPGFITIKIEGEDGTFLYKKISLKDSWVKNKENTGGIDFSIPKNINVNNSSLVKIFTNNTIISILRAVSIFIVLIFTMFYMNWKGYFKVKWSYIIGFSIIYFFLIGVIIGQTL